jgi:hypothetical protein
MSDACEAAVLHALMECTAPSPMTEGQPPLEPYPSAPPHELRAQSAEALGLLGSVLAARVANDCEILGPQFRSSLCVAQLERVVDCLGRALEQVRAKPAHFL